jgi:hypothetical protein
MLSLDAILKDEHDSARLLAEVHGDTLDNEVFERASAYEDPLLACIKQEKIVPLGRLESIEETLWVRIDSFAQNAGTSSADEIIDTVIAAERILSLGAAERIERSIIDRIEHTPENRPSTRFVWPVTTLLGSLITNRAAKILSGIVIVLVAAAAGVFLARPMFSDTPLITLITQAYGSAYRDDLVVSVTDGTTLACKTDGSLTLVNKAGSVNLRDDIALTIERASIRTVKYSVPLSSPTGIEQPTGSMEFSVAKRTKRQRFVVETPYFGIHVVGTKFTVARERRNGFSTSVSQGSVRITSTLFGDTVLLAGQTLCYIPDGSGVRIATGASAVGENSEGEVSLDAAQCRLLVMSDPPRSAVFINHAPAGITPFATVLPAGTYTIVVQANGRRAIDTTVELKSAPLALHLKLDRIAKQNARVVTVKNRKQDEAAEDTRNIATDEAKKLLQEAQRIESTDWKKALLLYKRLAASSETPIIYRETALFSFSRLIADKARDTSAAISGFSRYLILYPRGMFAGEALLRLSELDLTRNPASAVDYFRKFLAISPNNPRRADVAYHLGLLMQQHNEYAEALSLFTIALRETKPNRSERRHEIQRMIAEAQSLIAAGKGQPSAFNRQQ